MKINLIIKRCIMLMFLPLLFSCNTISQSEIKKFAYDEAENKQALISEILKNAGIEKFQLYGLPQFRLGNGEVSKNIQTEAYSGPGFLPEGPPNQEGRTPPSYKDLESLSGSYDRFDMTVNYSDEKSLRMFFDYLSFLVIIDDADFKKLPEIERILKNFVLNKQRGDILTVMVSNSP